VILLRLLTVALLVDVVKEAGRCGDAVRDGIPLSSSRGTFGGSSSIINEYKSHDRASKKGVEKKGVYSSTSVIHVNGVLSHVIMSKSKQRHVQIWYTNSSNSG